MPLLLQFPITLLQFPIALTLLNCLELITKNITLTLTLLIAFELQV